MIHAVHAGFLVFAHWQNFAAIFIGVIFGVVIGAIPGMTGTMGVALALPFTFSMPTVTGILALVGIYKGSIYGGSISAILIKTPGTPAAACTVLDGYPLARKGQAGKALYMTLYSACIADFISNISLIFFTGAIAGIALRFGPPQYFWLICFSLTIIAGVSGNSLVRGLISASLGLLAATVGLDPVFGTPRFTFGSTNLMGGLDFIPVLIGLFAIPEVLAEMSRAKERNERVSNVGDHGVSWLELKACLKTIIRGSLIGVGLGIVPGIGAAPSAFMSYSEARRKSPRGRFFGTGEIEGVAASESGSNGVCGATLIPLLALGVPGDVITAVILGAFMMHNLTPGPMLFQQHITQIYALFLGILLSSACLLIVGRVAIRVFSKVASIPNKVVFPVVLALCFYGGYAVNNSEFDLIVMVAMGVLGYFMMRFDVPPAPFLIGFILGPLFENNLRRTLLLSHGGAGPFFSGPICWLFMILTFVSVALIATRRLRSAGKTVVSGEETA